MATKWKKKEEILEDTQRAYDTAMNKAQTAVNNTNLAGQQKTGVNLADRLQRQPAAATQNGAQNTPVAADVLNQWMNRQPFQYDVNNDALYQQYKDRYMRAGQMAMKDTIGQASALTGGYGNSYATAAGNLAYNEYLAKLNDKVPELYQMAYEQYQDEGDRLKDAYAMLYGAERDAVADKQFQDQFDRRVYESDRDFNYNAGRDAIEDAYRDRVFDRQVLESDRDYNRSVYENDRNYDRSVYESDRDYGWGREQYYGNLGRQQAADQMDYQLALMKAGYNPDGTVNPDSPVWKDTTKDKDKDGDKTVDLKTVNYADLGFKDQYSMQRDLPEQIAQGVSSSGEYYDKLDDKLAEWIKKKYITEDEANELRKKLGPTQDMLNRWNYGETYDRYRTPGAGGGRRVDITR